VVLPPNNTTTTTTTVIGTTEQIQVTNTAVEDAIRIIPTEGCRALFIGGSDGAISTLRQTTYRWVSAGNAFDAAVVGPYSVFINREGQFMSQDSTRNASAFMRLFGRALSVSQGRAAMIIHEAAHQDRRIHQDPDFTPKFFPDGPGQPASTIDNHRLVVSSCFK
jgi:hypothetical protein